MKIVRDFCRDFELWITSTKTIAGSSAETFSRFHVRPYTGWQFQNGRYKLILSVIDR